MAKQFAWRDNPTIIARLIDGKTIQTWRAQEVVLKPNEACAFIVDGRIGDIVSEDVVRNIGGGIGRYIGDLLGATATDRRMLFAMTGPFDLSVPFVTTLSDGQSAQGIAQLRVQFRKDDIPKLLNIFANHDPTLDRMKLAAILSKEVSHRLVNPLLQSVSTIEELRGYKLQETFEIRSDMELRPYLSTLGLTLLKAMLITNPTDMERVNALRANLKYATESEEANTEAEIRKLELSEAATLRRIEFEVNIAKAKEAGEVAIELERELKDLRAEEARWEAELKRDTAQAELEMKKSSHKTEQAMALFEQVQQKKQERISQQNEFQNQRMDSQNELQRQMMEMAAQNGALTPEVMQEFLKQQTAQKMADTLPNNEQSVVQSSPVVPESPSCPSCKNAIQTEWKACPFCGTILS